MVDHLKLWCNQLAMLSAEFAGLKMSKTSRQLKPSDIFIGYTEDSVPTLVFKISRSLIESKKFTEENLFHSVVEQAKNYLLQCATSDGIIRLLIKNSSQLCPFNNSDYDADDDSVGTLNTHKVRFLLITSLQVRSYLLNNNYDIRYDIIN